MSDDHHVVSKPLSAQYALLRKPPRMRVASSATAGILSALAPLLMRDRDRVRLQRQESAMDRSPWTSAGFSG